MLNKCTCINISPSSPNRGMSHVSPSYRAYVARITGRRRPISCGANRIAVRCSAASVRGECAYAPDAFRHISGTPTPVAAARPHISAKYSPIINPLSRVSNRLVTVADLTHIAVDQIRNLCKSVKSNFSNSDLCTTNFRLGGVNK